ncbi:MAG: CCA tRNA nucleotidyltransferase [Clostridia bacterium]
MEAIDLRRTSLLWRRLWLRWFAPSVIPEPVRRVLVGIEEAGGEAVVVGGCVRDLLMGGIPEDWDVATSIAPQRVQEIFPRTVPTGIAHGTVTVLSGDYGVEVTTYRAEGEYTDRRRPDWVAFSKDLKEDLARRDFTFNAMALTRTGLLMDPFGGLEDLARRRIVTVGRARDRFGEDALRMVRAVRFAAQLDVDLDPEIVDACSEMSQFLDAVSRERIRLELDRILMSSNAARGMELLQSTGLLKRFWPELAEGVGVEQNKHHAFTVWEHSLVALNAMAQMEGADLALRLAVLLHDVAKPHTLEIDEDDNRHFHNHQVVGAAMARRLLRRLRYDKRTIERVTHLIRHHMDLHHYPQMKDSAIRRLINRVGLENIGDLVKVRIADRAGSGTKEKPLSKGTMHLLNRIDRVLQEDAAFGLKDLAVDGTDVMRVAGLSSGPAVGRILETLLDEVLEDPSLNQRPILERRIEELAREET